ncbi:MAG: hypothetical protein QW324_04780 [Thermofilaceae archaeon]
MEEPASTASTASSRRRRIGWSDRVFDEIISQFISYSEPGKVCIYDISSPPGTGKTYSVIRYILTRGESAICSFPTHQNQATALTYILSQTARTELKHYVLDYAGLENYCLFYRPKVLRSLLDAFRRPGDSYASAVQRLLGEDLVFKSLILADTFSVTEKILTSLAELFDAGKPDAEVAEAAREIVGQRGQYEVCTGVCPVGVLWRFYRRSVYELLSKPAVITWRTDLAEKYRRKHQKSKVRLLVANPEILVANAESIKKREVKPEHLLCPRLLLITRCVQAHTKDKSGKRLPTYISLRKFIVLTPHAALDFVLSIVTRQHEVSEAKKKVLLYIDEYDALVKPRSWRLVSLPEAKAEIAVAEMVLSREVGEDLRGVIVDEYLRRYAAYVRVVLTKIVEVVENSLATGVYHPLASIFIEGAFSRMKEAVLPTRVPVEYPPLSPRPVHILHFLSSKDGEDLFKLLLNPKIFFYDFAEKDPEWRVRLREAAGAFRRILTSCRTFTYQVGRAESKYTHGRELTLLKKEKRCEDVLSEVSSFIRTLVLAPRFACFYSVDTERPGELRLESIDAQLYNLIAWTVHSTFTSATPVSWSLVIAGPNRDVVFSDYEALAKSVSLSLLRFTSMSPEDYDQYSLKKYIGEAVLYTPEYSKLLKDSLATGAPITFDASRDIARTRIEVSQVSPLTREIKQYARISRIIPEHGLTPLTPGMIEALSMRAVRVLAALLRNYLALISYLRSRGHRVLIIAQNKEVAELVAKVMKMTKCHGDTCGEHVEKVSHFVNADRSILLTWFRSRIGRGVEIEAPVNSVVVVGSPYPRPRAFVTAVGSEWLFAPKLIVAYNVKAYNTRETFTAYRTLLPMDYLSGLNELCQAVGRATRATLSSAVNQVYVFIPYFIFTKLSVIAPAWLRESL